MLKNSDILFASERNLLYLNANLLEVRMLSELYILA
jgi:hypothetical protein